MTLTCATCGKSFERLPRPGPIPKYCSDSHRQRAYMDRKYARLESRIETAGKVAVRLSRMMGTDWRAEGYRMLLAELLVALDVAP